jgi:undecaprenyl-diphosphatase
LAIFVAVTAVGSSLLNNVVKLSVHRARPHLSDPVAVAAGKSFPSGHAQAAIVGYGILLAVFLPVIGRRWRPLAIAVAALLVLLIGFSRIALGVHYLSDVIGAYLIGTVWLIGMVTAFRTWRRELGKPVADLDEGLEPEHRDQLAP